MKFEVFVFSWHNSHFNHVPPNLSAETSPSVFKPKILPSISQHCFSSTQGYVGWREEWGVGGCLGDRVYPNCRRAKAGSSCHTERQTTVFAFAPTAIWHFPILPHVNVFGTVGGRAPGGRRCKTGAPPCRPTERLPGKKTFRV